MQTLAAAYFFMLDAQAQPMPARPAAAPVPAAPTIRCPQGEVPYRVVRMTPVRGATRVDFVGVHDGVLPNVVLERGIPWVCGVGRDVPDGTVCLARKAFLEGRLLHLLERVNRHTTVLPSFSGVDNGRWIIQLTTWDRHPMKSSRKAAWRWPSRWLTPTKGTTKARA